MVLLVHTLDLWYSVDLHVSTTSPGSPLRHCIYYIHSYLVDSCYVEMQQVLWCAPQPLSTTYVVLCCSTVVLCTTDSLNTTTTVLCTRIS